ncbi:MAG: methyltransferase domain-containing protein [Provencibacterium sp.]|nr:methyltransferase domain-containing protein [Provencibacterium sp.]
MAEYISTFITGFGEAVSRELVRQLPGAKVIAVYDGLIHYRFDGDWRLLRQALYLNNTFYLLSSFPRGPLSFEKMVRTVCREKHRFLISQGSYRVRFSRENQFAKVDKGIVLMAEKQVAQQSRLRLDRVNPQTEIWYIIRSEGAGFCGQLLHKREATEKNLNKGELRPELAYLLCSCAHLSAGMLVCDPFCGYGAIPRQLLTGFSIRRVLASDSDPQKIQALKKGELARKFPGLSLQTADVRQLSGLAEGSLDAVITDPPWGYYEQIADMEGFYREMLQELYRVLKPGGTLILLSARKAEFAGALENSGIRCRQRIDTLVNGKKAGVFCCVRE